jgi:hypothetical protein
VPGPLSLEPGGEADECGDGKSGGNVSLAVQRHGDLSLDSKTMSCLEHCGSLGKESVRPRM